MSKTFIVLAALAIPGAAWAQDQGGGGAAPPAAGGGGARGGFVVTDDDDSTPVYGVEGEDDTSSGEPGATGRPRDVPPVHTVHKGDTLWDICKQYFGNPWQWPKVWSYNPGITNPHWIFPGDQVHLTPASAELPAVAEMPAAAPKGKHQRIARLGGQIGLGGNSMRELGFVEEGELKAAATIVGSREEKILLSTGDQAYVEYPQDRPLHVGERYTIYKIERDVHHPVTHARVGYVVLIMGELQVDQITRGAIGRSTIVDANSAIERGYRVGPLARRWKNIEARKNGQQVEGYVVSALRPLDIIDSEEIIFVDKGQRDGVSDGNRFFVVRRGDGYKKLLSDETVSDDPRYPKEVVAEVLVIEAHDHTSVGYIARSNKEVHPGDRVEMRRGY